MNVTRQETTTTRVHHQYASRSGLTVGDLRKFLRDVDTAGISDSTSVRHDDRLASEGAAHMGSLSVEVRQTRDVPIAAPMPEAAK